MLGVTFFGLLLTPVFYVVIRRVVEGREPTTQPAMEPGAPPAVPVLTPSLASVDGDHA
jgi:hypothetical protein